MRRKAWIISMKKLVSWWNTGIILVILGMLVIVNIKSLNYFINSDFAAQIILADVINESHSLLPNEWNFSTEIHISFATLFSIFLLNEMWVHSPPLGAQGNFKRKEKHDTM